MASQGRNTATRDKHRRVIKLGLDPSPYGPYPPCFLETLGLCLFPGEPIDYDAPQRDPLSFTVDHITPLDKGGTDTLDNKCPSHWKCNRSKGVKSPTPAGATFITDRTW